MDLKFYFKKQFEFQLGNVPFFEKEKWNFQQKELQRLNHIEESNDLRYIDSYKTCEYDDLKDKFSSIIKNALKKLSKYTRNEVISLYLYLSDDSFGLTKGTYLCTETKLIKVTSANWVKKHSSCKRLDFIIACRLDKLVILGKSGLAKALKQAGVLEVELENKLCLNNEQVERINAQTNLNALSFNAGLNINEIIILGCIHLEG